jgi:hypothetical protein
MRVTKKIGRSVKQGRLLKLLSSGILHRLDCWELTDVSEVLRLIQSSNFFLDFIYICYCCYKTLFENSEIIYCIQLRFDCFKFW